MSLLIGADMSHQETESSLNEAYLDVRNVTKLYPTGGGVEHINLSLRRGQMLVLLGPSGCGKTTLLRTLAGLLTPDAGQILLDGTDLVGVPTHRRMISMVFQTWALFPTMTVEQNVAFGLKMRNVERTQRRRRVEEVLDLVGLGDFASRLPGQLSGGQQQRVAVARAIVTEPRLLLMDEPLSSLDHRIRVQLRGQIKQLQRKLELTGVYVTHDHTEALALGDVVAVMDTGRVVEIGDPVQVFATPKRRYTAEFLGLANVIDVTQQSPLRLTTSRGRRVTLTAAVDGPVVAVALRPDAIRLSRETTGAESVGTVATVEYQPGGVLHEIDMEAGGTLQAVTPLGEGFAPGDIVSVDPDWSKAVPLID